MPADVQRRSSRRRRRQRCRGVTHHVPRAGCDRARPSRIDTRRSPRPCMHAVRLVREPPSGASSRTRDTGRWRRRRWRDGWWRGRSLPRAGPRPSAVFRPHYRATGATDARAGGGRARGRAAASVSRLARARMRARALGIADFRDFSRPPDWPPCFAGGAVPGRPGPVSTCVHPVCGRAQTHAARLGALSGPAWTTRMHACDTAPYGGGDRGRVAWVTVGE